MPLADRMVDRVRTVDRVRRAGTTGPPPSGMCGVCGSVGHFRWARRDAGPGPAPPPVHRRDRQCRDHRHDTRVHGHRYGRPEVAAGRTERRVETLIDRFVRHPHLLINRMLLPQSSADLPERPLLPQSVVDRVMKTRRLFKLPSFRSRTIHIHLTLEINRTIILRTTIPTNLIIDRGMMPPENPRNIARPTTPTQLTRDDLPFLKPQRFPPANPPYPSLNNSVIIPLHCRLDHLSPPPQTIPTMLDAACRASSPRRSDDNQS